jgi:type IV pilus assembly protein PilC/MSHA biogenesis protein MshG
MPTFEYEARGSDGKVQTGLAFGPTLDRVSGDLRNRGLDVLKIGIAANPHDPINERPSAPSTEARSFVATNLAGPLVGQVPLTDLAFFFRQLSTMLQAGVPYVQCLNTLGSQSHSGKLREIIHEMQGHVEAGRPISAAMVRYPEVFTPVMTSLIQAGEKGGFLDQALALVAQYLDEELKLRNLYKRITFYPKLQVGASIFIIIGANIILASLGTSSRLSSPLTTWTTWIWLAPLLVAIFLFFRVGLAQAGVKYSWDIVTSNIPFIGTTLRQLAMAKFGRAFGALYRGGVAIPEAVSLSGDACGNEWLRTLIKPAAHKLQEGESIGATLRETGAFSPIVLDMVDTGERTGNLDQMLNKMADFYEDEAATRSTQTALMTGVLIGLLVAAYILFGILIPFWSNYANQYKQEM